MRLRIHLFVVLAQRDAVSLQVFGGLAFYEWCECSHSNAGQLELGHLILAWLLDGARSNASRDAQLWHTRLLICPDVGSYLGCVLRDEGGAV